MAEMSEKELKGLQQQVEQEARWWFVVAMVWMVNDALAPASAAKKRLARV